MYKRGLFILIFAILLSSFFIPTVFADHTLVHTAEQAKELKFERPEPTPVQAPTEDDAAKKAAEEKAAAEKKAAEEAAKAKEESEKKGEGYYYGFDTPEILAEKLKCTNKPGAECCSKFGYLGACGEWREAAEKPAAKAAPVSPTRFGRGERFRSRLQRIFGGVGVWRNNLRNFATSIPGLSRLFGPSAEGIGPTAPERDTTGVGAQKESPKDTLPSAVDVPGGGGGGVAGEALEAPCPEDICIIEPKQGSTIEEPPGGVRIHILADSKECRYNLENEDFKFEDGTEFLPEAQDVDEEGSVKSSYYHHQDIVYSFSPGVNTVYYKCTRKLKEGERQLIVSETEKIGTVTPGELKVPKDGGVGPLDSMSESEEIAQDEGIINATHKFIMEGEARTVTETLSETEEVEVTVKEAKHKITIDEVGEDFVTLTINSDPITIRLSVDETKSVDSDGNGVDDLVIKLWSITNGDARLTFKEIEEGEEEPIILAREVPFEEGYLEEYFAEEDLFADALAAEKAAKKEKRDLIIGGITFALVLISVILFVVRVIKKRKMPKNGTKRNGKQTTNNYPTVEERIK